MEIKIIFSNTCNSFIPLSILGHPTQQHRRNTPYNPRIWHTKNYYLPFKWHSILHSSSSSSSSSSNDSDIHLDIKYTLFSSPVNDTFMTWIATWNLSIKQAVRYSTRSSLLRWPAIDTWDFRSHGFRWLTLYNVCANRLPSFLGSSVIGNIERRSKVSPFCDAKRISQVVSQLVH